MAVANTESGLESVTVVSECSSLVLVSVSTAECASVTTAGVADVGITLVVPVVDGVRVGVGVGVAVWTPGEVISSVDLGVMSVESLDVTWLVVRVTPSLVVLETTIFLGWSISGNGFGSTVSTCLSSND